MYSISTNKTPTRLYRNIRRLIEKAILQPHESFQNKRYKNEASPSNHVWKFKKKTGQIPKLTWSILRPVPSYSTISTKCALCFYEKLEILMYLDPAELLNKCSEIMSKCPHKRKYLLSNYGSNNRLIA